MFARVFALLPLALLASATHLAARNNNECNGGTQYCCNGVLDNSQDVTNDPFVELGSVVSQFASQAALTCDVSVQSCSEQPTCCSKVSQEGLINIACSPINVG